MPSCASPPLLFHLKPHRSPPYHSQALPSPPLLPAPPGVHAPLCPQLPPPPLCPLPLCLRLCLRLCPFHSHRSLGLRDTLDATLSSSLCLPSPPPSLVTFLRFLHPHIINPPLPPPHASAAAGQRHHAPLDVLSMALQEARLYGERKPVLLRCRQTHFGCSRPEWLKRAYTVRWR